MSQPVWVVAVLAAAVAASEWLGRHTPLRHLGSALLVIVLAAVAANVGLIPSVTDGSPVYDGIFRYLGPLAIFWLLLRVHLASVLRAGGPMVGLFLLGAAGTFAGALVGIHAVGGARVFGALHGPLAGMYVGTYVGGSINFNAVALEYDVVRHGGLYAGAAVVDNAATTLWMAATVVLPRLLTRRTDPAPAAAAAAAAAPAGDAESERETASAAALGALLALGAAALWVSDAASAWAASGLGLRLPSILVLTTLALALAQIPAVQRLAGAALVGWFAVMLFLAAIGALCDVDALARLGHLAPALLGLVAVILLVHGVAVFGGAALLGLDPAVAAVASQANIGGSTSALALARSLERSDLALPGILVGALGNALGTYLGFLAVALAG